MALDLKHQTAAQFVARFREAYRNASRERLAVLARWVLNHLASGDITDAQVMNVFNFDAAQWATLKAKMQTLVAHYDAVQDSTGE